MRIALCLAAVSALALADAVTAYTCAGDTCTSAATYNEPSTCADGTPLGVAACPALIETTITSSVAAMQIVLTVPASRDEGGGTIVQPITSVVAPCTQATQHVQVTARNAAGESPPVAASVVLDRMGEVGCALGAVTVVSVQCDKVTCTVTWAPVAGAVAYRIRERDGTLALEVAASPGVFVDIPGKRRYTIVAVGADGAVGPATAFVT